MYTDDAADGISAVKCALWAAENIHFSDVRHIDVERGVLEMGHAINVEAHRWPLSFGSDAANVNGSILFRPVIRHIEVGHNGRKLFQTRYFLAM